VSYASAVDRLRGLIVGGLPPDLADATVVVGHPGILEDYAFGVTLYTLTLREDASRRLSQHPPVHETLVEADILIAVHAPPERGLDGIRLLELACRIVHQHPRFDGLAADATATVVLRPTSVDELTGLWQALATPLQPAVLCTLRVLSTQVEGGPSDA
jgi:hypothetical protein